MRGLIRVLGLVGVVLFVGGCQGRLLSGEKVFYQEDFEDGAQGWGYVDPECWRVSEKDGGQVLSLFKKASSYQPRVRSPYHIALLKGQDVGDFVLDVDVKSTHKDYGHRDVCLFFGRQDAEHFYYVHLGKKMDPRANQIFIVNGQPRAKISLTTTAGTDWDDKWHHVRIKRRVSTGVIEIYFDDMDQPVMTARDDTFKFGGIGLGSFDDTADFDNLRLVGEWR